MKKYLGNFLKIAIPLALGIFIAWLSYAQLEPEEVDELISSFEKTKYGWIAFSLFFAMASHVSRAYRWKFTLQPLGLKSSFWNNYHSVMIGYFFNLGIPRSGEVARCGFLARYEKMPFTKVMGTVIAERVADFLILIVLTVVVVYLQLDILREFLKEQVGNLADKILNPFVLVGVPVLGLIGLFLVFRVIRKSQNPLLQKLWQFIEGLIEGIKSIWNMEKKWAFIGHTFFIWSMYVAMFYVCFFSLENIQTVPIGGVLAGFVLGGFAIIATPGGIGAYPVAIQFILGLYGISDAEGLAFGWIVWAAQNILLIVFGIISLVAMPQINKSENVPADLPQG